MKRLTTDRDGVCIYSSTFQHVTMVSGNYFVLCDLMTSQEERGKFFDLQQQTLRIRDLTQLRNCGP